MSDDEKKLLKIFKEQIKKEENEYFQVNTYTQLLYDSHKTVLRIIEKQQKEIEALKQEKEYLNCIVESDKDNYINKDKIKAKIEELEREKEKYFEKQVIQHEIELLQSLLGKE